MGPRAPLVEGCGSTRECPRPSPGSHSLEETKELQGDRGWVLPRVWDGCSPDSVEGSVLDPDHLSSGSDQQLIAGSDNSHFPSLGFLGCRGHGPSWDGP